VDAEPVEADATALAEAAIGGASNSAGTAVSGAATLNNASAGTITTESLSTAVGATYTLTLTSNLIKATSLVFPVVSLGTSTQGTPCAIHVTPANGSVQIRVKNIDATNAFNGTLKIGFAIFQ
jgi:hypothetical protein